MSRALVPACLLLLALCALACATDVDARPAHTTATPGAAIAPTALPGRAAPPAASPLAPATAVASAGAAATGEWASVTRVVDGDTLEVSRDGRVERVRLVLVDTPEVHGGVECFGREASAFTAGLVPPGTRVQLERDVSDRDRYGRLLRYVYLEDGRMLNELLAWEGYATIATYPPDVRHVERLRDAASAARAANRGLWSACATAAPAAPPPLTPPSATPARGAACDPSYPDVCLPPGADDYDCAGGSGNGPNYVRGPVRVLPPDPHGLDRDGDGWGCD